MNFLSVINILSKPYWSGISAIGTVVASLAIFVYIIQLLWQKRESSRNHLLFLMDLANQFIENRQKYDKAWPILHIWTFEVIKTSTRDEIIESAYRELTEEEEEIRKALELCYDSVSFIYRISCLVDKKIIHSELLYLLMRP